MKRLGIIQSNYIPWKGYFDFIASVDEFVLLDDVQYTRRDWRNRNVIKTPGGTQWLSIPVEVKGRYDQRIDQTRIASPSWIDEHLAKLRHAYARAPHFDQTWPWVLEMYESCRNLQLLTAVNEQMLRRICSQLQIGVPLRRSSEFRTRSGKNERLIDICRQAGAGAYLSGPAAQHYIDETLWSESGISVEYKSYAGYAEYPQLHPPFEHAVSVLDVFFNTGPQARSFVLSAAQEHA